VQEPHAQEEDHREKDVLARVAEMQEKQSKSVKRLTESLNLVVKANTEALQRMLENQKIDGEAKLLKAKNEALRLERVLTFFFLFYHFPVLQKQT